MFRGELTNPAGNRPGSSLRQQNQRLFQDDVDVPEYLRNSFEYDETVLLNDIHGERRSNTPCYFWRKLLNSSMTALKYDYITRLCLYYTGAAAHYTRGFLLDILGYDDLATLEYTQAIELNPKNDRYYNNRGNLYMLRGYSYLAVLDFTKAIEINPNRAEPYYNRGRALERMGESDKARLDYETAVKLGICKIYPSLKLCR